MKTIWIRQTDEVFKEWLSLRGKVLRLPLGLFFSPQDLEEEAEDLHLLAYVDGMLAGGLAVRELGESAELWKIRQVAVEPDFQGHGIGRELMRIAEDAAREKGILELVLHSRADVAGFYESLGFQVEGEPFVEVGLLHRRMRKGLS